MKRVRSWQIENKSASKKQKTHTFQNFCSGQKRAINDEFLAWAAHEYRPNSGHLVLYLDGPKLTTTRTLIQYIDAKDLIRVEFNEFSYEHGRKEIESDSKLAGATIVCGDFFVVLDKMLERKQVPRCIFLDLMCANISETQIAVLQKWEWMMAEKYHALFITLCQRATTSIQVRQDWIIASLKNDNFGHHMTWGYRRDNLRNKKKRSSPMMVLILGSDPPIMPLYRPQKIIRVDKTRERPYLVKFWFSKKLYWMCNGANLVDLPGYVELE
jgi:hypothetical protein